MDENGGGKPVGIARFSFCAANTKIRGDKSESVLEKKMLQIDLQRYSSDVV